VPGATVILETTHSAANVGKVPGEYDANLFLRTTDEQFYTAAHLAYARGGDGLSVFNFAYFREFGAPGRGPFHEPPFHVFARLRDPAWLAQQPQHYFLAGTSSWAVALGRPAALPKTVRPNGPLIVPLDLAPPTKGWERGGKLRLRSRDDLGVSVWTAKLNGRELAATNDRSAPYSTRYHAAHGTHAEKHRAWMVPANALRDGMNYLEFAVGANAAPAVVEYIDLGVA
jgi:hypothetical protein